MAFCGKFRPVDSRNR